MTSSHTDFFEGDKQRSSQMCGLTAELWSNYVTGDRPEAFVPCRNVEILKARTGSLPYDDHVLATAQLGFPSQCNFISIFGLCI